MKESGDPRGPGDQQGKAGEGRGSPLLHKKITQCDSDNTVVAASRIVSDLVGLVSGASVRSLSKVFRSVSE